MVRVPGYSPYAVAEHTVALILALNRKIHRSHARVREGNFELSGLLGFDLHGRTGGIVGTGNIGAVVARIMDGFGCRILTYDVSPNSECDFGSGHTSIVMRGEELTPSRTKTPLGGFGPIRQFTSACRHR